MEVAEERRVPAAEREEGHGGGDADVDADHAGLDAVAEFTGGFAAAGEYGGAVAVGRRVGEFDGSVEVFHADDIEHRAEHLLLHRDHAGLHVIEDGRADEETVGCGGDLRGASVGQRLRALASGLRDQSADALGVLAGDDGAHLRLRVAVGRADADFRDDVNQRGEHGVSGLADGDGGGTGHAALAGAAEGGLHEPGGGVGHVGIGHDEDKVLRPSGGLAALAVGGGGLVDILGDGRRADERDRLDGGMAEECIHRLASAMDDVEDACRQAGLHGDLRDADRGERDLLARLEDERVAAGDGHRPHPKRNHGGEVERRDSGDDAEWLPDRVAIDAAGHVLERLAHEECGGAAGIFDVLQSAPNVPAGLGHRLAVFTGHAHGEFLEMVLEHDLELH